MTARRDTLFPVPPSDPLFVYDLTIWPTSAASAIVDDEGRWDHESTTPVVVPGYAAPPDTRTLTIATQAGAEVDVVALVGRDVVAHTGDHVQIPEAGLLLHLGGTYRVTLVRPNPAHTRLLCRRVEGVDEPHYP